MLLCDKLKRPQTWQNFEAHPAHPGSKCWKSAMRKSQPSPRPILRLLPLTREGGSEESLRAEGEEQMGGGKALANA